MIKVRENNVKFLKKEKVAPRSNSRAAFQAYSFFAPQKRKNLPNSLLPHSSLLPWCTPKNLSIREMH